MLIVDVDVDLWKPSLSFAEECGICPAHCSLQFLHPVQFVGFILLLLKYGDSHPVTQRRLTNSQPGGFGAILRKLPFCLVHSRECE